MNKYELAVIVSAKLEDDERAATIEKVKEQIARFGGTVTAVARTNLNAACFTRIIFCVVNTVYNITFNAGNFVFVFHFFALLKI